MNTNFYVQWHFDGTDKERKAYLKKERMYQQEFVEAHNTFCNLVNNGVINALNAKWDELHPGVGGDNDKYMAFMQYGYQIAIKMAGLKAKHITFDIGEEAELIGHLATGGIMYFTLKPC